MAPSEKLAAVRKHMEQHGLDAFVVPTDDPHMSEYAHPHFARREWVSEFTGSAGLAVITKDKALLWTDGRYFLQASMELSEEWTLMKAGLKDTPTAREWLKKELGTTGVCGVDPWVHTYGAITEMQSQNLNLKFMDGQNPIDLAAGTTRPEAPCDPVYVHPMEYAGESVESKLEKVRKDFAEHKADVLLVTMLDEVAWLLNLRGKDIEFNPLFFAYVAILNDSVVLYTNPVRLSDPEVTAQLASSGIVVKGYGEIEADLAAWVGEGKVVWVDKRTVNYKLASVVQESAEGPERKAAKGENGESTKAASQLLTRDSPIPLLKAIKNDAELQGMREAHLRDAAALVGAFSWLEAHVAGGNTISEAEFAEKLIEYRSKQAGFLQPSFPTIAGSGPNGAIIHYRPEQSSARKIGAEELLLVDSGAQFVCGTTDITRCFHFGTPTDKQKQCYTLVLKGHISLASAVWPEGIPGCGLDAFARQHLWRYGLNYLHGTGHGVGAAINVHEGPQSVSGKYTNTTPLKPGMIVSNEPGYYEDGQFGIRIENLEEVVAKKVEYEGFGEGKAALGMEELTFVPIETKLVDQSLLTAEEVAWLDAYHAKVRELVQERVEGAAKEWLLVKTQPLAAAA